MIRAMLCDSYSFLQAYIKCIYTICKGIFKEESVTQFENSCRDVQVREIKVAIKLMYSWYPIFLIYKFVFLN